jgi:hypothetical protein
MKKIIVIFCALLILSGCDGTSRINLADYGYDTAGTLYIKKINSISQIYEWNDAGCSGVGDNRACWNYVRSCIDVVHDGTKGQYCTVKIANGKFDKDDYREGLDKLKRLEKRFHQIAGDSVVDRIERFFTKNKNDVHSLSDEIKKELPLCPIDTSLPDFDESEEVAKKRALDLAKKCRIDRTRPLPDLN